MNNAWFRKILMAGVATFSIVTLMTGCGGGGGTASGGGATSTLVLQVASINGRTALLLPHNEPTGAGRVVNAISQLFLSDAWAATAGVEVYLDGVLQGSTGVDGRITFPITGGVHTIRLVDPSTIDPATGQPVEASFSVTAAENTTITIPNIVVSNGAVSYDTPVLDDGGSDAGNNNSNNENESENENGSSNENESENENGSSNENESENETGGGNENG